MKRRHAKSKQISLKLSRKRKRGNCVGEIAKLIA